MQKEQYNDDDMKAMLCFFMLVRTVTSAVNRLPAYFLSPASIRKVMYELHPSVCTPTIEHCVPQSMYAPADRWVARDMHGLMCLPSQLNLHRSNYKLRPEPAADPGDGGWQAVGEGGHALKHTRRRLFVPPPLYRGMYARGVGYFVLTYPDYAAAVHARVLDFEHLLEWSLAHPPSHQEKVAHHAIAAIQENTNPFHVDVDDAAQALYTVYVNLVTQVDVFPTTS